MYLRIDINIMHKLLANGHEKIQRRIGNKYILNLKKLSKKIRFNKILIGPVVPTFLWKTGTY